MQCSVFESLTCEDEVWLRPSSWHIWDSHVIHSEGQLSGSQDTLSPPSMAGHKRPHSDGDMAALNVSPFMPMFEAFRSELDEHQERRERIIKASRDITALSKKM